MMKIPGITKGIRKYLFLILAISPWIAFCQYAKKGGIGFRVDENPPVPRLNSYDSLLTKHYQTFSFAVTTYVLPLVPEYVNTLKTLSNKGVELMDNTPTHASQFFNVLNFQDTASYHNRTGVDHISGQKICLKYTSVDTTHPHGEGKINLDNGNRIISQNNGEFHDLPGNPQYFALYINPPLNRLFLYYDLKAVNPADPDTLSLRTFWEENVNLQNRTNLGYHKMMNSNVVMHDTALKLLGQRSLYLMDSLGLTKPACWIHPDGPYPYFSPSKLKQILGNSLGYHLSTSYLNPSYFCFNEYNPGNARAYSVQSEEVSMEQGTFRSNVHTISEAVAKHYAVFDVSRLKEPFGGWNAYLARVDSLLSWCNSNYIPVRTYSQWKSYLYDSVPSKVTNIFPRLDADLDGDGWPDGFDHDTATIKGIFDPSDGVPASSGKCFKILGGGTIFRVTGLAGLEKGKNKGWIWTKGTGVTGSRVSMTMSFPETGHSQTMEIPCDTNIWVQHSGILNIPDSISIADFSVSLDTSYHDTVKLSGFGMRSAGFLKQSRYPLQEITTNRQFDPVNLNSLIIDSIYNPDQVFWTFRGSHSMWFTVDTLGNMHSNKPSSFWIGSDSVYAVAHSPDGISDSCFFSFKADTIPSACAGLPVTLSILDTLTSSDYIVWSSFPKDSAFIDTTVSNPTVNPKMTTRYRVKVYNLLGNINKDSVQIIRHQAPVPGLFGDSSICKGRQVQLNCREGSTFLWSTGDTTSGILVKPDTTTVYWVRAVSEYGCTGSDTTRIIVLENPVVTLDGLMPQYCNTDDIVTMTGLPPGGVYGGSEGVSGNTFNPALARPGQDTVWYRYTNSSGCSGTDTVYVFINLPHIIPKQPDTNLCADRFIILHAGVGADHYIWSTGSPFESTVVDTTGRGLGTFKVWVYCTKAGCVSRDTAIITFVNCTGVSENKTGLPFTVYPNPVVDKIMIHFSRQPGLNDLAELINITGRILYSENVHGKHLRIGMESVPSGIYILHLQLGSEHFYTRIMKF